MFIVDFCEAFDSQRLGELQKFWDLIFVDIHLARVHEGDQRCERREVCVGG